MDFQEVVRRRRMVRTFTEAPVPKESLERILDNAVRGPSAGFSQGQSFLLLTEPADRERFWAIAGAAVNSSAQTRAGPTGTRRAGRCRSGTSTPGWRRC
jgi:nitroreductase